MKGKGVTVPYWELGHELYYDEYHNLGRDFNVSPEAYAKKSLEIAKGLRGITPDSKIIFIGCKDTGVFTRYRYPNWNTVVLDICAPSMDYLAVHNATVPIMNITPEYGLPDLEDTAKALLASPRYIEDNLEQVCREIVAHSAANGAKIAVTDYSVMFTDIPAVVHGTHSVKDPPESNVEWERNTYCVSALLEAMLLNLFIRRNEVEIACRFSLLSQIYSSLYRYVDGRWVTAPQAFVHSLYNRLADHLLVHSTVEVDCFDSPAVGIITAQRGVPYLDCIAVKNPDDSTLLVYVVNRNLESSIRATIDVGQFPFRQVTVKTIASPQFYSRNTAQNPENIVLHERTIPAAHCAGYPSGAVQFDIPKHSLVLLIFSREEWL